MDINYCSRNSLSFDEIIYFEGSGNENKNAARKVGNGAVNGKTDTYTEGSNESGDGACVNSEVADECNNDNAFEDKLGYVQKSLGDRLVQILLLA